MIPGVDSRARDPCTWLFLVNGGQQTFDEELKVRENFEKLYEVFVSNGVVKAENVVCATGTGVLSLLATLESKKCRA